MPEHDKQPKRCSLNEERKRRRKPMAEQTAADTGKLAMTSAMEVQEDNHVVIACDAWVAAVVGAVPELSSIFRPVKTMPTAKPLFQRTTDEFLELVDSGMYVTQIAQLWGISCDRLVQWLGGEPGRLVRAKEARKRQAAFWDWVALQVLVHAPNDRNEIQRAEKIAQHCRWRAEMFNRDEYGRQGKTLNQDDRLGYELSTQELEIIAQGGMLE